MKYDVIVVGKGNAALCAALSAAESGAKILMLEAAPENESGGNSRFAGGQVRVSYNSVNELKTIVEFSAEEIEAIEPGSYPEDSFYDDLYRVTNYRTDPDLAEILVTQSQDIMVWLRSKGVRFGPYFAPKSGNDKDKRRLFPGMSLEVSGGGAGLIGYLDAAAKKANVEISYETRASSLIYDGIRVQGVMAQKNGARLELRASSTILACGGFEGNPEWRARYLGPGWDLAKVRGTRFNQGDGLRMALEIGAAPYGNWSGCHATGWDRNAPEFGDIAIGDQFQKHSYPFGLLINAEGKRFFDEGTEFFPLTYAKYGSLVLRQPGQFAWQVFDAKAKQLLRSEYRIKLVTKVSANTLEELAAKMEGVDAMGFLRTVDEYNSAVRTDVAFNPSIKDGKCTDGIEPRKSNWAQTLDTAPYEAYAITCGITFTFGGLRIARDTGQVLNVHLQIIPGLFCAGEMVGGLFYFNYPGATGLVSGAIFGRIAGRGATNSGQR